jgi:hypothetical protein
VRRRAPAAMESFSVASAVEDMLGRTLRRCYWLRDASAGQSYKKDGRWSTQGQRGFSLSVSLSVPTAESVRGYGEKE